MSYQLARANLLQSVKKITEAFKTVDYFIRTLEGAVRDLYRMEIDEEIFITELADLIQQQLTRAWHEGMRENDLDPIEEMEPEWQEMLDTIILNEYDYVDQFAHDITQRSLETGGDQTQWDDLLSRARLWANRYNDVVNQAILATKEQKLMWVFGDTEHCSTCESLNGIVAWTHEWDEAGVRPQNPPNGQLECGGWRCQCSLVPTGNRHTRNALDAIYAAVS